MVHEVFESNSIYFSVRVGFGLLLKEARVKVVEQKIKLVLEEGGRFA